jgi:hypothetical protein
MIIKVNGAELFGDAGFVVAFRLWGGLHCERIRDIVRILPVR